MGMFEMPGAASLTGPNNMKKYELVFAGFPYQKPPNIVMWARDRETGFQRLLKTWNDGFARFKAEDVLENGVSVMKQFEEYTEFKEYTETATPTPKGKKNGKTEKTGRRDVCKGQDKNNGRNRNGPGRNGGKSGLVRDGGPKGTARRRT